MDVIPTLAALAATTATAAFCGWRGARPPDFVKGPRLMPWRMLMVLSGTAALFLAAHLLNLLGLETGGGRGQGQ
jgi:hypothetical protein